MSLLSWIGFSLVACFGADTSLSEFERRELETRLSLFYSGDRSAMDRRPLKIDVATGEPLDPNREIGNRFSVSDPLVGFAGKKVLPSFQRSRCRHLFRRKFPFLDCDRPYHFANAETSEGIDELTRSWIPGSSIVRTLDSLPVAGSIDRPVWSGDYWRMRWGLTSYRYSGGEYYARYDEAVAAYEQPKDWLSVIGLSTEEAGYRVARWSPSEKYDLLVGDENLGLTNEQKAEGGRNLGEDGNVESWFGICHGWAPASFLVPVPQRPFSTVGARGIRVTWYPDDVRAMATLAWANGDFATNFSGGRCNQRDVSRFENGRLSQPECFDNNPATFHLALGNLIGGVKAPFIMDAAFDYQVWNQPILSYGFEYFNPLDANQKGSEWSRYAVDYDDAFKARDRFQRPLTRGRRVDRERYDDSRVNKVVGVSATVVYLAGSGAQFGPTPRPNSTVRITYTYDLELEKTGSALVPTGGEWHENTHPDFLWVPQQGSIAGHWADQHRLRVDLEREPYAATTSVAEDASRTGYPLCQVLERVIEASSGESTYRCGG